MYRIRKTKTGSGKTAIQVVLSVHGKTKIFKHLGSANTKKEMENLVFRGRQYIENTLGVLPLLPELSTNFAISEKQKVLDNLHIYQTLHKLAYEALDSWYKQCGFETLDNALLKDLAIMRFFEPSSKLRALDLLERYFGLKYSQRSMYRALKTFGGLKDLVQSISINYAKKYLRFDFHLVFYDVTTLYFETFTEDELRKCGFSKDHKANQPQIIVGLLVTTEGFPVAYTLAEGNTFEGRTMVPLILDLQEKFHLETLTVVADAAMLSEANLIELRNHHLSYIVGARVSNLPIATIKDINRFLESREGVYFQKETNKGALLCDYSLLRAVKDKSDRQKQLTRAKVQIEDPNRLTKSSRFLKTSGKTSYSLNQALIEKDELLDGIKGYYTNLVGVSSSVIVSRYHDLWRVEKSFRIAKSDLLARPVYHFRKESIESHLLIVFITLCLVTSLELSTGLPTRKIRDLLWEIQDLVFKDPETQTTFTKRMDISSVELNTLLKNMGLNTY